MARERKDFFRESDVTEKEKLFVLAFEGNETEEQYFEDFKESKRFNDDLIYLHLLTRDETDTKSAPIHVFQHLKEKAKEAYALAEEDELWMIIDTDRWRNIPEIVEACASNTNMYIAVSNPSFEFWLLLHIADIETYDKDKLVLIKQNKRVSNRKRYVDQELTNILGSYNKSKLKTEAFLPHVEKAIEQAKNLDVKDTRFPDQLGSHVYKLVEKLSK